MFVFFCVCVTKEMQLRQMQLSERAQGLKEKDEELEQLKVQLRQLGNRPNNEDYEARIQSLTEMLMTKQTTIQTITTEKNALRLQLEKLEVNCTCNFFFNTKLAYCNNFSLERLSTTYDKNAADNYKYGHCKQHRRR